MLENPGTNCRVRGSEFGRVRKDGVAYIDSDDLGDEKEGLESSIQRGEQRASSVIRGVLVRHRPTSTGLSP